MFFLAALLSPHTVAVDLSEHPSISGNSKSLGTVTGIINGSGSITAALGLLIVGPMTKKWGWNSVWYFMIFLTVAGTALMGGKIHKEIWSAKEETKVKASANGKSGGEQRYQSAGGKDDRV